MTANMNATRHQEPSINALVNLFNRLFSYSEKTCLKMGKKEPFYQASKGQNNAIIYAREDYFSSALHEIAHWTLAGEERRKLDDFGYWYEPEGRSKEQQIKFEQVEIKPQAIEWLLSLACQQTFHLSVDNFSENVDASQNFNNAVYRQALVYFEKGLPQRAQILFEQLCIEFRAGCAVAKNELTYV